MPRYVCMHVCTCGSRGQGTTSDIIAHILSVCACVCVYVLLGVCMCAGGFVCICVHTWMEGSNRLQVFSQFGFCDRIS